MAIFTIKSDTRYTLDGIIKYIVDQPRHNNKVFKLGGFFVQPYSAVRDMLLVKKIYSKEGGVQYKHFVLNLEEGEGESDLNHRQYVEGVKFPGGSPFALFHTIAQYLNQLTNSQLVYAVHGNKKFLHMHVIVNSVTLTGEKLNFDYLMLVKAIDICNKVLQEYGLHPVRTYPNFYSEEAQNDIKKRFGSIAWWDKE